MEEDRIRQLNVTWETFQTPDKYYYCEWKEGNLGPDPNDIVFKRIMKKHIPNIDFDLIDRRYGKDGFRFIIDNRGTREYLIYFYEHYGKLQKYSFDRINHNQLCNGHCSYMIGKCIYDNYIDVEELIYDWRIRLDDSFSIFYFDETDPDEWYILPIQNGLIEDNDCHFSSDLNIYKKAYINTFNYLITTINYQMKDPAKIITKYFNFEHLKTDLI